MIRNSLSASFKWVAIDLICAFDSSNKNYIDIIPFLEKLIRQEEVLWVLFPEITVKLIFLEYTLISVQPEWYKKHISPEVH